MTLHKDYTPNVLLQITNFYMTVNSESESGEMEYDDNSDTSSMSTDFRNAIPEKYRDLILSKIQAATNQFNVFNQNQKNQKIEDVRKTYPDLSDETIKLGLECTNNNELRLNIRLRDEPGLLDRLKRMSSGEEAVNMELITYVDPRKIKIKEEIQSTDGDESDDWRSSYPSGKKRRKNKYESDEDCDISEGVIKPTCGHKKKQPRIRLNDAMSQLESLPASCHSRKSKSSSSYGKGRKSKKRSNLTGDQSSDDSGFGYGTDIITKGESKDKAFADSARYFKQTNVSRRVLESLHWSTARINAYYMRSENQNQYYYRFNDPGEEQSTGKWSAQDRFDFLRQIVENGVDYSWGLFSMKISGRVGYQCSNYYRQLIREGVIIDENYVVDSQNKLTFRRQPSKEKAKKRCIRGGNAKKKRFEEEPISFDGLDDVYTTDEVNCLPGFLDTMTMMEVVKPTISPYGHVLGYDSWIKILNEEPKNTCPFTKQKLTRRQLVKLTYANLHEYQHLIIDMTGVSRI